MADPSTYRPRPGSVPDAPGVYRFFDASGRVVYVGKAKSLRARVRSYFRASGDDRPFVSWLDRLLADIEVIVTPTEKEALVLERELIAYTRERIAHYKCPRSIDFRPELPRHPTGKLYKKQLREQYWAGTDKVI